MDPERHGSSRDPSADGFRFLLEPTYSSVVAFQGFFHPRVFYPVHLIACPAHFAGVFLPSSWVAP